jgi:hypothetical protein
MLPIDDPKKLKAALEQLEAEKQRRIDANVEKGEAVRVKLNVVVGAEDEVDAAVERAWQRKFAELREAGDTRKIYLSEDDWVIITGVPRANR